MRLHFTPGSPFSRIIRVLIRELSLSVEEVEITEFPPRDEYFQINPLGQAPALETEGGVRFPTRFIIDFLLDLPRPASLLIKPPVAPAVRRSPEVWEDDQALAVILAMGDALAAIKYQRWAGLLPSGPNLIGFDPAERHADRVRQTLDWLEANATPSGFLPGLLSAQDIALSCLALWTEARGGFPWRGRPNLETIVAACEARPSFIETQPQKWP